MFAIKSSKKKKQEEEKQLIRMTGVEINGNPALEDNNRVLFLLTNALLNFLVVVGTTGCFIKPFSIKANMPLIIFFIAVIAVFTAFLYYNMLVKMIGYLLAFSGFIFGIFNFRYLIKGGFGFICNHIMEFLQEEFALPIERSYDVYGYNETFSVTVCLIFIAFAVMLLFNMVISESKGFVLVFLFTFPIAQMGMYFDLKINVAYFAIYITGLLGLFFLRNSRHYHMESKKRKGYRKSKKKNKVTFDYINDGRFSFSFIAVMLIFIASVMLLFSVIYPQDKFHMSNRYDELKDNTRDFTERLALVGFWGMFNPDGSAGGVGRSRLGQSKYVRLDYETDLVVKTMVEKGEGSIYLKSFNGTFYKDEFWETISEHKENTISLDDYGIKEEDLENLTSELLDDYNIYYENSGYQEYSGYAKKIEIANIRATTSNLYLPNYAAVSLKNLGRMVNDDEMVGDHRRNYVVTSWYVPLKNIESVDDFREDTAEINQERYDFAKESELLDTRYKELETERKYSEYVHDMYMEVPEENARAIREFCEKYNLDSDSDDIVEKVAAIFEEDYEYTLMPGKTPRNKEFVNYFLSETKKGYCSYFATSATLIFRYLGIPARYAGGYVLQRADFTDGTFIETKDDISGEADSGENNGRELYSDWTKNYSENNTEVYPLGLCEYELDDSCAHAWVEIYIDGFGWIPVETTPSSDDVDDEEEPQKNNNLMDFFANNVFSAQNINNMRKASVSVFFAIAAGAILLMAGYVVMGIFIRGRRRNAKSVIILYEYMVKCLTFAGIRKEAAQSYEDYGMEILNTGMADEEIIKRITRIVEREKFSSGKNQEEDVVYMSQQVLKVSDKVYAGLKWYKKFMYRYVKWL